MKIFNPVRLNAVRRGNITKLARERFADRTPTVDEFRTLFRAYYVHVAARRQAAAVAITVRWAARNFNFELSEKEARAILEGSPTQMYRDELGEYLMLTDAERERLGIWSILPCDVSPAELDDRRTAKAAKRQEKRRRRNGVKPRAAYLAEVKSKEPWVALGISRATFFRQKAKAACETGSVTASNISYPVTHLVSLTDTPCAERLSLREVGGCFKSRAQSLAAEQAKILVPNSPCNRGGGWLDFDYLNPTRGDVAMNIVAEMSDTRLADRTMLLLGMDAPTSWKEGETITVRRGGQFVTELVAVDDGLFSWSPYPWAEFHIELEKVGGSYVRARLTEDHMAIIAAQDRAASISRH